MPTVKNAKGVRRGVKDTGWLLRHARSVTSIKVKVFSTGKAYLYAYLDSADTFIAVFDDHHFCLEWLCTRRSLRHVKVKFGTTDFLIRQAVRVTDANGTPYHLIACECDNTHLQNNTVCRWCSAKEWRGSPDPCSPDDYWIDDKTNERVSLQHAAAGARAAIEAAAFVVAAAQISITTRNAPSKAARSAQTRPNPSKLIQFPMSRVYLVGNGALSPLRQTISMNVGSGISDRTSVSRWRLFGDPAIFA